MIRPHWTALQSFRMRAHAGLAAAAVLLAAAPANAQIAVLGSTVEERMAAPGESYTGMILVTNPTTADQRARIYQTDYAFAADGTSDFGEPGSNPRSNTSWITTSNRTLVIPAGGQAAVSYTVRVPTRPGLQGTYWSAIMVEGTPTAPPVVGGNAVGVGSVIRYAVQVATHIQNSGSRRINFATPQLVPDSAGQALELDVTNTGERAYRPVLWVELYDSTGALSARLEQVRGLVYPGSSVRQRFALRGLEAGAYKAVVFADTGDDSIFAAQYRLDL